MKVATRGQNIACGPQKEDLSSAEQFAKKWRQCHVDLDQARDGRYSPLQIYNVPGMGDICQIIGWCDVHTRTLEETCSVRTCIFYDFVNNSNRKLCSFHGE